MISKATFHEYCSICEGIFKKIPNDTSANFSISPFWYMYAENSNFKYLLKNNLWNVLLYMIKYIKRFFIQLNQWNNCFPNPPSQIFIYHTLHKNIIYATNYHCVAKQHGVIFKNILNLSPAPDTMLKIIKY